MSSESARLLRGVSETSREFGRCKNGVVSGGSQYKKVVATMSN